MIGWKGKNVRQWYHHTEHLLVGFMGSIGSQLNAFANSGELESDPITRYFPGVWTPVRIALIMASRLISPHHTCANDMKNNWSAVKLIPGNSYDMIDPFFAFRFWFLLYAW